VDDSRGPEGRLIVHVDTIVEDCAKELSRNRDAHFLKRGTMMIRRTMVVSTLMAALIQPLSAQTPLSAYADAKGYIDVQKLTCAQLAGTFQEDADMLTAWYSGWYNGLAKKHLLEVKRAKEAEHEVIQYCKANQDKKIIEAIAVVFKDMRAKLGIKMKP
jgi:hypothetical protein